MPFDPNKPVDYFNRCPNSRIYFHPMDCKHCKCIVTEKEVACDGDPRKCETTWKDMLDSAFTMCAPKDCVGLYDAYLDEVLAQKLNEPKRQLELVRGGKHPRAGKDDDDLPF